MKISCDLSDLTIVVLSHNRIDDFKDNLLELVALAADSGCELIVVDNASTDGTIEMVDSCIRGRRGVVFVSNDSNLGVAGGRNSGWRLARCDLILNLDEDISASRESIEHMANVLRRNGDIGVVSPIIVDYKSGDVQYDYGSDLTEIANFTGACHMTRRSLATEIGFNDEECIFGGEELDFSIRARLAGYRVVFTRGATVRHNDKVRVGKIGQERRTRWVYNFVRIFYKYFPLGFASVLSMRYFLSHLVSGMRVHGFVFARPLFLAAWRGFRAGRRVHQPVGSQVVSFYRNPALRPEFGNVPLHTKLGKFLRRRHQADAH